MTAIDAGIIGQERLDCLSFGLKEVMEKSEPLGMQTFDTALMRLYVEGRISLEEALKNADSPNNLRLKINLSNKAPQSAEDGMALSLEELEEEKEDEEDELSPPAAAQG